VNSRPVCKDNSYAVDTRPIHEDEATIIRRAQSGDRAAFARLYDRYQPAVFTYLYYRLGDQASAEEMTSEVFVRMVEKINGYTPNGRPLLAWLYTIARNLRTDHLRQNGQTQLLPLDERLLSGGEEPSQAVEGRLTQACLQEAVRLLTEEQRQVVVAKFIEGRSNAEVARLLDKPEGAVKSLQHRALAALRKILEQQGCY
jgi:RNA polymerase sigma-70 factor, ECF subfamily